MIFKKFNASCGSVICSVRVQFYHHDSSVYELANFVRDFGREALAVCKSCRGPLM